MLTILIADDHALFRGGLRRILEDALAPCRIEEVETAADAMTLIEKRDFSLLLLDISMPGRSGLDIIRDLRSRRPHLPILILSMHSEVEFAAHALKEGANGYITKNTDPEQLLGAVRLVLAGKSYVNPEYAAQLAVDLARGRDGRPHDALSARELEVLRGLVEGRSLSLIAADLHLSVKTVSTYRGRILEKMRMESNADLVRYAARHALFSP